MLHFLLIPLAGILALGTVVSSVSAQESDGNTIPNSIYEITSTVRVKNPQKFGMNFQGSPFKPWNESLMYNNWVNQWSFEPISIRHNFRATGGGADYIENVKKGETEINPTNGKSMTSSGADYYKRYPDGFFDGADVYLFHVDEQGVHQYRKDTVKRFLSSESRIELSSSGEPVQKGDLYLLDMLRLEVPNVTFKSDQAQLVQRNHWFKPTRDINVTWRYDDQTFCPEGGSTASMHINLPATENIPKDRVAVGMEHQYLRRGGKELNFRPGKTYRCEIWMRNDNLEGEAVVQVGDRITKTFTLTDEWKKYSFEVPNVKPIKPGVAEPLLIGSVARGSFWIDNLIIYEEGVPPFAIWPERIENLKEYQPGVIRDMSGRFSKSLDAFLSHGFERLNTYGDKAGGFYSGNLSLKQYLELCRETGAKPYIMSYILWTDEEIDHFMEYLGAPADVGYGKKRAAHGQTTPWIDEFEIIYLECANEMWNANFGPQGYSANPELSGAISNRLFKRAKASTWNTQANIRCVASAFSNSLYRTQDRKTGKWNMSDKNKQWTMRCVSRSLDADVIATAPSGYIGGWDGDTIAGQSDEEALQTNLFYSPRLFEPKLEKVQLLRKELGLDLEMLMYEAGPGYLLPNPTAPMVPEEEAMQKMMALSTATLDNFLFSNYNNGNCCYFKFKGGTKWATHAKGFSHPLTVTLALMLRNVYCRGAMLEIKETYIQTVDLPEIETMTQTTHGKKKKRTRKAHPNMRLTRVYCYQDGDRYSFPCLNRSATQSQRITLKLPYTPQSAYTMYMLGEGPRDTNRESYTTKIREIKGTDFKDGFSFVLPPGCCCTIVNHAQ